MFGKLFGIRIITEGFINKTLQQHNGFLFELLIPFMPLPGYFEDIITWPPSPLIPAIAINDCFTSSVLIEKVFLLNPHTTHSEDWRFWVLVCLLLRLGKELVEGKVFGIVKLEDMPNQRT